VSVKLDPGVFAAIGLLASLGACSSPPAADPGGVTLSQVEATAIIDRLSEEWFAAVSAGDLAKAVEQYTDDAVRMEPGGPTMVGKEAILAWLQSQSDRYTFDTSYVTDEVLVLAPDWILMRNHGEHTATPKGGGDVIHLREKWLGLVQRQPDGSWKYRRDIGASDVQETWKQ
jgi:uncharacterized protein (TIGR02246 family)